MTARDREVCIPKQPLIQSIVQTTPEQLTSNYEFSQLLFKLQNVEIESVYEIQIRKHVH